MSIGQSVQVATIEDGTQINFVVIGGRLYRIGADLATREDVTPGGITIDANARVYLTPFSNRLLVNDGVHTPWVASNLLSTAVTGTVIDYQGDGSAWRAFGPAIVWGGSAFFIVRERNGEGKAAGTPEKRTSRAAWCEADDPLTGWHQKDFDNEWDIIQNGTAPMFALFGTNLALYYWRDGSIGYVTGTVGPDLQTTASHDAVDEATGTRAPATILAFGNAIYFADVEGRVFQLRIGGDIKSLWLQHRRVVDLAETRFPDVTARTACAALVPELDLYLVALWSPNPESVETDGTVTFPTKMYAWRAESGTYVGEWTIGPLDGDKVAVHAMGTLVGANGEPVLVILGKPSLASVDDAVGIYALDSLDKENWLDDGELPDLSVTTPRLGYSADTIINTDQATAIVKTVPDTPPEEDNVIASITVAPPLIRLKPGQTKQLTVIVRNEAGRLLTGVAVTWATDAPAVATVGTTGIVLAGGTIGAARITASAGAVVSNPCTVENEAVVIVADTTPASITVTPASITLEQGQLQQLVAVVRNAAGVVLVGSPVTWLSDATTIAAVSATGVVTGGAAIGTAQISAVAGSILSAPALVTRPSPVFDTVPASVSVTPATATIQLGVGHPAQLVAVVRNAAGQVLSGAPISWSSTAPAIVSVDAIGDLTALALGSASVIARSGTASDSAVITVTAAVVTDPTVASITVSPTSFTLAPLATQQLVAIARNAEGEIVGGPVLWTSDTPGVATVDASGLVTAVADGIATIRAQSGAVLSNAAMLTVSATGLVLLSHDFEDGTLGPFEVNGVQGVVDVINDPTPRATGKVCRIHYENFPSGGNFDCNQAIGPKPENNPGRVLGQELWFQGDFYLDTAGLVPAQRKLLYWGWSNDSWGFRHQFNMVLTSFNSVVAPIPPGSALQLAIATSKTPTSGGLTSCFGPAVPLAGHLWYGPAILTTQAWHRLKVQLKIDSAFGAADGILRMWLDGVLFFECLDMSFTSADWTDDPATYQWVDYRVGQQLDASDHVIEDRYIDDVIFSAGPIP